MWSREPGAAWRRLLRLAAVMALAGAAGGCFQPLYAEKSPTGGPGIRDLMAAVEIEPIPAPNGQSRIAVEIQNELRFGLTGGSGSAAPTHRLTIRIYQGAATVILDRNTGRAEFTNYSLDASYTLTDLATKKPVMTASATTRVTYDIPGQEQRFAAARGLRDAETRGAKQIAEMIRMRLASFFTTGS